MNIIKEIENIINTFALCPDAIAANLAANGILDMLEEHGISLEESTSLKDK